MRQNNRTIPLVAPDEAIRLAQEITRRASELRARHASCVRALARSTAALRLHNDRLARQLSS